MKTFLLKIWKFIKKYSPQIVVFGFLLFLQTLIEIKTELYATKENISAITDSIKVVEHRYNTKISILETALKEESDIRGIRRDIYTNIVKSLRVFFANSIPSTEKEKEVFLNDYSTVWLWASDSTIFTINKFINLQIVHHTEIKQHHLAYSKIMLAMRKDIISNTKLDSDDFMFIQFVQK